MIKAVWEPPYASNHQAITTTDESPLEKGVLYAGTDDGRVWVTKNDGGNWTEITKGLPDNSVITCIEASKYIKGTLYITINDRKEDNIKPFVYVSSNYGSSWKAIANNLPAAPVNVIREDPKNNNILYCGTDLGIYITKNKGLNWQSLQGNLPSVLYVTDLFVHPRDNKLVIATFGRGLYVLDNIEKLQQ
jgi:photosystem II stability/assembly factor-like uncharacterized protein